MLRYVAIVQRHEYGIEDAVAIYLKERVPKLKSKDNIIGELAQMFWAYQGRALTDLPEVCMEYATKGRREDGEPLSAATATVSDTSPAPVGTPGSITECVSMIPQLE